MGFFRPHFDANSDCSPFSVIRTQMSLFQIWMLLVVAVKVLGLETFLHDTQLRFNFAKILYYHIFNYIKLDTCMPEQKQSGEGLREKNMHDCDAFI